MTSSSYVDITQTTFGTRKCSGQAVRTKPVLDTGHWAVRLRTVGFSTWCPEPARGSRPTCIRKRLIRQVSGPTSGTVQTLDTGDTRESGRWGERHADSKEHWEKLSLLTCRQGAPSATSAIISTRACGS